MIVTFICTYALVALVLFVVARFIFPSADEVEERQLKSRSAKRFTGGTA